MHDVVGDVRAVLLAEGQAGHPIHDGRSVPVTSEAGDRNSERIDPWSGERVDLGLPGRVWSTLEPDVFTALDRLEMIDGADVEHMLLDEMIESPDGMMLAIGTDVIRRTVDLRTRRIREVHPADVAGGPLPEHLLDRGTFAARIGPDGASSLWIVLAR